MLTKEERTAIAERFHECDYLYDNALYQILFGHNVPSDTTFEDDSKAILERLADLIDPTCSLALDEELSQELQGEMFRCNKCDAAFPRINGEYRYCPNCGARVVQNEA